MAAKDEVKKRKRVGFNDDVRGGGGGKGGGKGKGKMPVPAAAP